jgi:hypothetical protein
MRTKREIRSWAPREERPLGARPLCRGSALTRVFDSRSTIEMIAASATEDEMSHIHGLVFGGVLVAVQLGWCVILLLIGLWIVGVG